MVAGKGVRSMRDTRRHHPYLVVRCDCGDDELTPEIVMRDLCSVCGMRRRITEARPPTN